MTSITSVQTLGVKKFTKNYAPYVAAVDEVENDKDQKRWSSIAGKARKQRLALLNG